MEENKTPLYSIVTVCFNEENKIHTVMDSVRRQSCCDYEYIIIDGKSEDNTVEIIKSFQDSFDGRLQYITEKDSGLYDAMNKAIKLAKGEYIAFMNADDTLQPGILQEIAPILSQGQYDIVYGNAVNVYRYNGNCVERVNHANPNITIKSLRNGMGMVHQSMFTRVEFIREMGGFNTKYKIGADWDFLIRSVKSGARMYYADALVCSFQTDGVSAKVHNRERHIIRRDNQMYSFVDGAMIRDYLNIKNMIQLIIGQENFRKLRFYYNKRHRFTIEE